jgi:hypothetical protein
MDTTTACILGYAFAVGAANPGFATAVSLQLPLSVSSAIIFPFQTIF